jgi:sulfate permease, SulP family
VRGASVEPVTDRQGGRETVAALLPGLARLRRYDRSWLRGDVLAGVTVVAYLVPQVMAYAQVAGLPATAGLWAAMVALLVYAFVGSSPQLSVGPESTTALMTATAIAPLATGDPSRYAALAAALALGVGLLCLVGRIARLGFLADLLSKPVLVGYLAGVAVIMIVGQLDKLTGVAVDGESIDARLTSLARQLDRVDRPTVLLAAVVLVFLLVVRRLVPRAPVPLLGVLLGTAAVALPGWDTSSIATVGHVTGGVPVPRLPDVGVSDLRSLLLPALGVAIVGYTDNVLTGRAFAGRRHEDVDANQELFALGAANVATGLCQGFPVSSSGSRTVIADSMGSRSQLYSLVALGSVVVTMLFFRPLLGRFPVAALGALVVYAALRLIDIAELRRLARCRRCWPWSPPSE